MKPFPVANHSRFPEPVYLPVRPVLPKARRVTTARMKTVMPGRSVVAGAALLPAFAYPYGALDENAEQALRAAGMLATMTSEEHANKLTRSPACLFGLGRFERTGFMTTAQLLEKLK